MKIIPKKRVNQIGIILLLFTVFLNLSYKGLGNYLKKKNLNEFRPVSEMVRIDFLTLRGGSQHKTVLIGDSRVKFWEVENKNTLKLGYPGATSTEITSAILPYLNQLHAEHIIIHYGINDLKKIGYDSRKSYEERIISGVMRSTKLLVTEVKKTNPKCKITVIGVIPPINHSLLRKIYWRKDVDTAIHDLNRKIHTLEKKLGFKFISPQTLSFNTEDFLDDLHFSKAGYKKLNQAVF